MYLSNRIRTALALVLVALLSFVSSKTYDYKVKYLEVPLDHFGYGTNKTFQLRYLVNDTYVKSKGSILFYTGNEGDIELFAENTGFIWEKAQELDALIIFAEHRYYGQSLPFGNKSYDSPDHLGFLTSEQALADFALLLDKINPDKTKKPVIAIGGSYGGMLAAWFRMKYPHIVTGSLAASAPVLQFGDITPCNIFSKIVTSIFKTAKTEHCSENIKKSWQILRNFSSTDAGRSILNVNFKFCTNLTKPENVDEFFDYLEDVYGNLAMANYPYENSFLMPLPAYPVKKFCEELDGDYKDIELIQALNKAINIYNNFTGKASCLNITSAYDSSMGTAGWNFQSCTEMVMPMCSGGNNNMFREKEWDINKFSNECFKTFGVRPRNQSAIINYGGKNIEFASNIIFSNGLLDPWSGGGVLRTRNNNLHVIIITEGAHHLDLRPSNPNDPGSVVEARRIELRIIKTWIEEFWALNN